jgi:hypothetical protein
VAALALFGTACTPLRITLELGGQSIAGTEIRACGQGLLVTQGQQRASSLSRRKSTHLADQSSDRQVVLTPLRVKVMSCGGPVRLTYRL